MTTQEVANKLVTYIRLGLTKEAQADLYSDDIICIEPDGGLAPPVTKGKAAVYEKGKQFAEMVETRHGGACSDPIIAGNFFSITMMADITLKKIGRVVIDEVCVYQVKNGKIISEQFFISSDN